MTTLMISYPKTGSFFLWSILEQIAQRAGIKKSYIRAHPIQARRDEWPDFSIDQFEIDQILIQDDHVYFQLETRYMEPIEDVPAYVQSCSHVWTHAYFCQRSEEVLPLFQPILYLTRDPRDALVSMAHFSRTPFIQRYHPHPSKSAEEFLEMELENFLGGWVRHSTGYLEHRERLGIRILRYEDLRRELSRHVAEIAKEMGCHLDDSQIRAIVDAVDLDRMREANPQHVRSGTTGGFRSVLTREQQRRALDVLGDSLEKMGYSP